MTQLTRPERAAFQRWRHRSGLVPTKKWFLSQPINLASSGLFPSHEQTGSYARRRALKRVLARSRLRGDLPEARFWLADHSRVICLGPDRSAEYGKLVRINLSYDEMSLVPGIAEWSYENVCHLNLTNRRPSAIITTDSRLWLLVYNG